MGFEGVLRVLQKKFKESRRINSSDSKMFQDRFKEVSHLLGIFKGASNVFQVCFKKVSQVFHGCLKEL